MKVEESDLRMILDLYSCFKISIRGQKLYVIALLLLNVLGQF